MPLSIYIHIPYCISKCPYCDFNSYATKGPSGVPDRYVDALIKELKMVLPRQKMGEQKIDSIYFGGGTPSLLSVRQLQTILQGIGKQFGKSSYEDSENSIEVNPASVTMDRLNEFAEAGINRITVGVQSFGDAELKTLGRIHSADDAKRLLADLDRSGFANFGIDLIFGIPGQTVDRWLLDLETAMEYHPRHISAYSLTYAKRSPIYRAVKAGRLKKVKEKEELLMFLEGARFLTARGYEHYEISNFALDGYRSRHNMNYWSRKNYIGLGAGAHSFLKETKQRSWNVKSPSVYILRLEGGLSPMKGKERLSPDEEKEEILFLSLRKKEGLCDISILSGHDDPRFVKTLSDFKNLGYMTIENGSLRLTLKGFFLSNEVISRLATFL